MNWGICVCEDIVKMVCLVTGMFRVYLGSNGEKSEQTEKRERPFGSSHDVTNSKLIFCCVSRCPSTRKIYMRINVSPYHQKSNS